MPKPKPKDWTWKRLQEREGKGSHGPERPDRIRNKKREWVRNHAPHKTKPAIERFLDQIVEIETEFGTCWAWQASEQFWVKDDIVMSPWKYSFEIFEGKRIRKGVHFRWLCQTPKCCTPEHLEVIGRHCKRGFNSEQEA